MIRMLLLGRNSFGETLSGITLLGENEFRMTLKSVRRKYRLMTKRWTDSSKCL